MKKVLLATLVALPFVSFANPNTIQFQGEVTEQTCSVLINGTSANPTVLLPSVPTTALAAATDTAGLTNFTVALTGCTVPSSAQNIGTVFVGNNLTVDERLGNSGTATNVTLQLVDPSTPTIPLDLTGATPAPGLVLASGDTSAAYDFAVRYYAEGASTAGSVLGSVQYSVSYP